MSHPRSYTQDTPEGKKKLTSEALIRRYAKSRTLFHLSKIPLDLTTMGTIPQKPHIGFNRGGRPEGLWIARGSAWIHASVRFGGSWRRPCCYLYGVLPDTKLLVIKNKADFLRFDKQFPSYWFNFDTLDIELHDKLTDVVIKTQKKRAINASDNATFAELLEMGYVFETAEAAKAGCEFYTNCKFAIERFKYKNWGEIAKHYNGIFFDCWDPNDKQLMYYFWFQSLDVSSGCIWEPDSIRQLALRYYKIGPDAWVKH